MTVTTNAGLTRMTIGAVEQPQSLTAPVAYEPNRVSTGVTKLTIGSSGNDSIEQSGVTRHNTFHDRNTSSVMGTMQRVNGVDTVELQPGNSASRTNIKQALKDGLVTPIGNGLYANASEGRSYQPQQQPAATTDGNATEQLQADPGAGVFIPEEDAQWQDWIDPLPQHSFDAASAGVTAAVLAGDDGFAKSAAMLAESAGIEVAEALNYVEEGYALHERHVAREAAAMGVTDKQGFYGWLREAKPQALHRAIQALSAARDVTPFRVLALEYTRFTSEQATRLRPRGVDVAL